MEPHPTLPSVETVAVIIRREPISPTARDVIHQTRTGNP